MKKVCHLIVVVMCLLGAFAAFAAEPDISEPVELVMYLVGDGAPDADLVWAEVNKLAREDLNATVKVHYIPWAASGDKGRLLLSSGENFDLIFSAEWFLFREQVELGAYYPLSDILPTYGKGLWDNIPKEAWQECTYADEIYMVPYNSVEFLTPVMSYRKELAEKYGIPDGKITTIEQVEVYLEKAKEELGVLPLNMGSADSGFWIMWRVQPSMRQYPMVEIAPGAFIYVDEPDNVIFMLESQGYQDWITLANRWADKGFWSRSALGKEVRSETEFVNKNGAAAWHNPLSANQYHWQLKNSYPEAEFELFVPVNQYPVMLRRSFIGNGMAINANAKNPERALMLLDKLHNDERYNQLTTFGIRGTHWDLDANGDIVLPEGLTASESGFPWDKACPWGWREDKFYLLSPIQSGTTWQVVQDLYKDWATRWIISPYGDFIYDRLPAEGDMMAVTSVSEQYAKSLEYGIFENPEASYREFMQKLNAAGWENYKAEVLKQWNAYLADKK